MKIKIVEKLGGRVTELDAVIFVVEDNIGNPISIGCELAPDRFDLCNIRQDSQIEFNRMLQALGINKTVIAERLSSGEAPADSRVLYIPEGR